MKVAQYNELLRIKRTAHSHTTYKKHECHNFLSVNLVFEKIKITHKTTCHRVHKKQSYL